MSQKFISGVWCSGRVLSYDSVGRGFESPATLKSLKRHKVIT